MATYVAFIDKVYMVGSESTDISDTMAVVKEALDKFRGFGYSVKLDAGKLVWRMQMGDDCGEICIRKSKRE